MADIHDTETGESSGGNMEETGHEIFFVCACGTSLVIIVDERKATSVR